MIYSAILGSITTYSIIEYCRYRWFIQKKERLKNVITPLSRKFNHDEWFSFFIEKFELLDSNEFQLFIENIFWNLPIKHIEPHRIIEAITVLSIGCELVDAPEKIGEQKLHIYEEKIHQIVTALLVKHKSSFVDKPELKPNELICKLSKPFIRINHAKIENGQPTPVFQPIPLSLLFNSYRLYGNCRLQYNGFIQSQKPYYCGLTFWVKTINNNSQNNKTLLFLHGLGCGIVPYIDFIISLIESKELKNQYSQIILVELPGISRLNQFDVFPTTSQIVDTIVSFTKMTTNNNNNNNQIIDAIGHSIGSIVLSYITNQQPDFLHKRIYIDSFAFFPGSTKFWEFAFSIFSFEKIMRTIIFDKKPLNAISQLLFLEFYHQQLIHNSITYHEYCNREINLDEKTMILCGGKDIFVSSHQVYKYIQKYYPKVKISYYEKDRHGELLLSSRGKEKYVNVCSQHLHNVYRFQHQTEL